MRNNAEWCELVANSHGVPNTWSDSVWYAAGRMPPFYPSVVSLEPGVRREDILELVQNLPPECGWKDSFADLDLTEFDFSVGFEANWYALSGPLRGAYSAKSVATVTSADELDEWTAAWDETPIGQSIFLPNLIGPNVRFLFRRNAESIDAGLVATESMDAVGLTNTFGSPEGIAQCICGTFESAHGLPLVGYGSADELRMMAALGFKDLGRLRVWLR